MLEPSTCSRRFYPEGLEDVLFVHATVLVYPIFGCISRTLFSSVLTDFQSGNSDTAIMIHVVESFNKANSRDRYISNA